MVVSEAKAKKCIFVLCAVECSLSTELSRHVQVRSPEEQAASLVSSGE